MQRLAEGTKIIDGDPVRLGALLRTWRHRGGYSQSALAKRAGLAASTVSRWEAETTVPNVPELEAVLRVLAVPPDETDAALRLIRAPRAQRRLQETSETGVAAPVGGDLLRAMRLRRGMTQAQLASLLGGVPQTFIARWERGNGDAWPDPTRLQEICFHLGARAEEAAALTTGRFRLSEMIDETDPDALHVVQWRLRTEPEYAPGAPLKDLRFFALEARLHTQLARPGLPKGERERIQRILSWTYSRHAEYLQNARRVREAVLPAQHAITLQQQLGPTRNDEGWVPALLALAADRVRTHNAHRAGLLLLQRHLESVRSVDYQGWMLVRMAGYALKSGLKDEAVELSGQALRRVESGHGNPVSMPAERRLRRRDHAAILLSAGRAQEAADFLPADGGAAWGTALDHQVRDLFLRTEVLSALGVPTEADTALRAACALVAALESISARGGDPAPSPLRDQANALSARLS